jgi:hypothetical protein
MYADELLHELNEWLDQVEEHLALYASHNDAPALDEVIRRLGDALETAEELRDELDHGH